MDETVAALKRMDTHSAVREIAGMTSIQAGGVNYESVGEVSFFHEIPEYAFRGRRSAYVAEAYEKHFHRTEASQPVDDSWNLVSGWFDMSMSHIFHQDCKNTV